MLPRISDGAPRAQATGSRNFQELQGHAAPRDHANFQEHTHQAGATEQRGYVSNLERAIIFGFDYTYVDAKTGALMRYEIRPDACYTVLGVLRGRMDFDTSIVTRLTQERIAAMLGWHINKVKRAIRALRAMGLISTSGKRRQCLTYYIAPRQANRGHSYSTVDGAKDESYSTVDGAKDESYSTVHGAKDESYSTVHGAKDEVIAPWTVRDPLNDHDDDGDHLSHHQSIGALAEKAEPKNAANHRGQRAPAAKEHSYTELPAAWRELGLSRSLDRKAQICLAHGWVEDELINAYEISRSKRVPDAYLSGILDNYNAPPRPAAVAHQHARRGSYQKADFVDTVPRVSYQVPGYELPPLPAQAVAAA